MQIVYVWLINKRYICFRVMFALFTGQKGMMKLEWKKDKQI
jgi:hypothetical protein